MTRIPIAAVALLLAAPATLAQTTTTTPPSTSPPAASQAPAASPSGRMTFYSSQPGQMRATTLIGLNVKNNANETIGEINELVIDKDGRVAAAVIGVGGLLGMGEREVALDYKSLNIKYDQSARTETGATTVTVDATKDSLKAAPEWKWTRDANAGGTGTQRTPTTPAPGGTTR
jgi:hypothetical protein